MAEKEVDFPFGTPQEPALMCQKHDLMPIDVTCEDCEEFICSKCAKEDHKDHDWITISSAATLKTRGLLKSLKKIEDDDIQRMEEKIQKASQQIEVNKQRCESEVSKLQKHFDAIVQKLQKIKENHEKTLRESLECKNAEVSKAKSSLEEKRKSVLRHITYIKENGSTMTDMILIKVHREMTKILSTEVALTQKYFSLTHLIGDVNDAVLETMIGQTFDAEQITVTETDSFHWNDAPISVLEEMNEDTCFLRNTESPYFEQVKKSGRKEKKFSVVVNDVCVTDNNEVYITDRKNNSISCLSPSGSVSSVFSTHPLRPIAICQTLDNGLLVNLGDTETDYYQPNSLSRRLVRHVTMKGDVIREYEYQEDGQTRLFTIPKRIAQNGNTDICVINWTKESTGELLILSFCGSVKVVYPEQDQRDKLYFTDLACDSHCNIILSELHSSNIHLLSLDGKFIRYLLTANNVNHPTAMSLKKSTLWIGVYNGLVKVYQYKPSAKI